MGAWGTKPNENDGSQDLLDRVWTPMAKAIERIMGKKRLDSDAKWERIGVMYELSSMHVPRQKGSVIPMDASWIKDCLSWLDDLSDDKEWLESWYDGGMTKADLRSLKGHFRSVLKET